MVRRATCCMTMTLRKFEKPNQSSVCTLIFLSSLRQIFNMIEVIMFCVEDRYLLILLLVIREDFITMMKNCGFNLN